MHIPDGFVSGPINTTTAIASLAIMAFSAAKVKQELSEKAFKTPLLATMAAFVFAAQMLNFPIGGGTSGHFLGAATITAILGPWSACLVLSLVLVIQGLLFGDGGITALGSNILNMGAIGGIAVYPLMRGLRSVLPSGRRAYSFSAAIASWASVVLASSACAIELALSGTSPLGIALPAMAGTHAIIGVGEALICSAVLLAVSSARPDILPAWASVEKTGSMTSPRQNVGKLAGAGLALAIALAVGGSPFASPFPDGLEKVAEERGFITSLSEGEAVWTKSPFPDYMVASVTQEKLSTSLAGLIGTIMTFGVGFGAIRLLAQRASKA